jgi:hypothetical protein
MHNTLTFASLILTVALTACASSGADTETAPTTLETEPLHYGAMRPTLNGCSSDLQVVLFTRIFVAPNNQVNAALTDGRTFGQAIFAAAPMAEVCEDRERKGFARSRVTVKLQGAGLFSVQHRIDDFETTKGERFLGVRVLTQTFDMKTGAQLALMDLFDDADLAALQPLCQAGAARLSNGDAVAECREVTERLSGAFTLEREGLRLYPFPTESAASGVLLRWRVLDARIKHPAVAKLAAAAR